MATDWLFFYMTRPLGLLVIGLGILLPFLLWRVVLGLSFRQFGFRPLFLAYGSAFAGLLVLNFVTACVEYSSRVAGGILKEPERWPTVFGWTLYTFVLSLVFVLPAIGLVGVPLAGYLLRKYKLSPRHILISCTLLWLALSVAVWLSPANQWHVLHRLESLGMALYSLLPSFILVGAPFLATVAASSRSPQNARA